MRTLSLIVALAITSAASAESINIDFTSAFGVPSDAYGAAAGQPGVWNLLESVGPVPAALLDINGDPSGVTLTADSSPFPFSFDNPGTSGDDQALMDDLFDLGGVGATLSLTFSGLTDGSYDVYTYAWAADSDAFRTSVDVGGLVQLVGGAWPGGHAVGVTHALHSVDVVGGMITIDLMTAEGFGSLNGIQLAMIPAPAAFGLLGLAGVVGSRRRRR